MSYRNTTIAVIAGFAAFRVLYILLSPFDISPDEAHYWEWSRRLDMSYYSKGPGVAYVIAFFTALFGDNDLGVRVGAVVLSSLASYVIFLIGRDFSGSGRVGFYSMLLPNLTPVFAIGSILMTTDVILILFWGLAVYSARRAVSGERLWWYGAGVAIGLGFLGKYTIALIAPCIFIFMLLTDEGRGWLRRKEPYLAAAAGLLIASPVFLWNLSHGQVTLLHTLGQVNPAGGDGAFSFTDPLEFLASQAGLLTPLVFAGAVYGVWRSALTGIRRGNHGELLLFLASAPVFFFFLLKSFHGKVQANWAVAAYVTAIPACVQAYYVRCSEAGEGARKALKAASAVALIFGALSTVIVYFPWALEAVGAGKVIERPPYNRVTGWEDLGKAVSRVKKEMEASGRVFIMSDTYQIASELAFYTEGNPVTYNVNTGSRRMNQYDLWPGFEGLEGRDAIYVKGGDSDIEPFVEEAFESCGKEVVTVRMGARPLKDFTVFRCRGFGGFKGGALPERY